MIPTSNRFKEDHAQRCRSLGRSASSEIGADRGLWQRRLCLRRHVASRLAAVPAGRDLGLAGDAARRTSTGIRWSASSRRQQHRYPDHRHRHRVWLPPSELREALRAVRVVLDTDADRACDPHLQHHDGRAPAGRGGADRGAMSAPRATSQDAPASAPTWFARHDFVRYASTLFVPPPPAPALLALYAFNVEISRVRLQVSQPLPGEIRLQWWTDMLAGAGHGGVEGNPVAAELLLAIRDWRLPVEPLSRLIEEHQFDLYNDPMPTMAALEGYINDTSSALFSLARADCRLALRGDRSPRAPCRSGARHGAGDRGPAAGRVAASVVRAAAIAGAARHRHGRGVCRQADAETTGGDRSTDRRSARHLATALRLLPRAAGGEAVFLPLAMVRRDLDRLSRADDDPFVPQSASRFRTLWTLWRASRSREFRLLRTPQVRPRGYAWQIPDQLDDRPWRRTHRTQCAPLASRSARNCACRVMLGVPDCLAEPVHCCITDLTLDGVVAIEHRESERQPVASYPTIFAMHQRHCLKLPLGAFKSAVREPFRREGPHGRRPDETDAAAFRYILQCCWNAVYDPPSWQMAFEGDGSPCPRSRNSACPGYFCAVRGCPSGIPGWHRCAS